MHDERHDSGSIFLAFMLGGLVGAGLALLLAPQSGSETRQRIRDYAEGAKDKAEDMMEGAKTTARSAVEKGRDYIKDKKSVLSTAIEAGKEAYEKEKERHSKEA